MYLYSIRQELPLMCEGGEISLDLIDLLQLTLQNKQLCARLLHTSECVYTYIDII